MAHNKPNTTGYGLGSQHMLEKIDSLFACGVGELVNLPQIVVVGDQSCGKSSVLEGLIKMPLPRDSGLCTRFATQIIFRRAPQESIAVSIIPDKDAPADYTSRLRAWGRPVSTLDSQGFEAIMRQVHELMDLSSEDDLIGTSKPTFSNDVFCLEISGPDQEHLSVIDVPGIFKNITEGVTNENDIELVRRMVKGYMENPRSVMLAVIPANVDVATQEILTLAKDADPPGDRTLGVLTKPDLVDEGGEPRVINLLEGRAWKMKLGWHIIRNPGQASLQDKDLDRDALETKFFRYEAPWNAISKENVGITSLRDRLHEILFSLVKKEFPKVKSEIKAKLESLEWSLNSLGPERSSTTDQRAYLTDLAAKFQRLVQLALNANHGADNAFEKQPGLHISPTVMARMKSFADDMTKHGQTYSFLTANDVEHSDDTVPTLALDNFHVSSDEESSFDIRQENDVDILQDILHPQTTLQHSKGAGVKEWLLDVFNTNRGFELGTFNASILATVMKKQTFKWTDLSLGFVSDVVIMVHRLITESLIAICSDEKIRQALLSELFEDLVRRYREAIVNTKFLLEVESSDTPMTLNHYFNDNLQKSRQSNVVQGLRKNAFNDAYNGEVVRLDQAVQTNSMSNDQHVVLEIHDILKSYYKVSLKTFIDNVCKQAVVHYLLHPDKGPLALFSPTFVGRLSPERLEEIAGEESAQKRQRAQLSKEIESLTKAKEILR